MIQGLENNSSNLELFAIGNEIKAFYKGDVVFFDNYDHVGIVAGFDKGTSVMIIEGNTTMDTVRLQPYNIGNFKGLGHW